MPTGKQSSGGHNEGIIATNVSADVMAVGKGATATKYQIDSQTQKDVMAKLDAVIELINRNAADNASGKILTSDLAEVRTEVAKAEPDQDKVTLMLKSFGEKFTLVKGVLKNASEVVETVKTIASLLKIPLAFLAL